MQKLIKWLKDLLLEEFEVRIWITGEEPRVYRFKKIEKLTPTHIIAREMDGRRFEMATVDPFNYQVKKIH